MHSRFSPDSHTSLEVLSTTARQLGLRRIALTDHNTAEGALELARREPELTIVGEEVRTTEGEVIGLFIHETIEPDRASEEVMDRIHGAGGLTYIPHPLDPRRAHYSADRLRELGDRIDILETYNPRCQPGHNRAAAELAELIGKPGACGCDAHVASQLQDCWLEMEEFAAAPEFLANLRGARQVINGPAASR